MIFVFGAVILAFALMEIDIAAITILAVAYLFILFSGVYYRLKYEKEM